MTQFKELLGKRIKELRTARKLTQEQLAELIDIASTSLSKIEIGMYHPTGENLEKIAKALNVEPYELYMFNHHRNIVELKKDINLMLENANEDSVRLAYKILCDILR